MPRCEVASWCGPKHHTERGTDHMPTSTGRHRSAVATSKSHEDSDGAVLDASYPDTYLDCRTIQHDWRRIGCYHAYGELVRVLHCNRCGTDRHDHWSASGHRM